MNMSMGRNSIDIGMDGLKENVLNANIDGNNIYID